MYLYKLYIMMPTSFTNPPPSKQYFCNQTSQVHVSFNSLHTWQRVEIFSRWMSYEGSKKRVFPTEKEEQSQNLIQSNLAIRNFLVTLKLFLNAKSFLFLWSKWQIGHRKWFLNTNLFLIKPFLIAKFDCTISTTRFQNLSTALN